MCMCVYIRVCVYVCIYMHKYIYMSFAVKIQHASVTTFILLVDAGGKICICIIAETGLF